MDILSLILIVFGLVLFETVSSVDNAIINADVLSTMGKRARRWFLLWGIIIAVFLLRGALPWAIVWVLNPELGPVGSFTAALSHEQEVVAAIENSSPILLSGGGIFLIFLFFHWLFLETKRFGLKGEYFFQRQGVWFYAVVSVILSVVVWFALKINPLMAFGAVVGSTAFFIVHGFKENAAKMETKLLGLNHQDGQSSMTQSDVSKIFYLEVIDATFSIDGVIGAFAFTLSVPLILLGNGIGAIVVRQLTVSNIDRIKKYVFLKNGAMYSILVLGIIMLMDSFGLHIPSWLSPLSTAAIVGYFFLKSRKALA